MPSYLVSANIEVEADTEAEAEDMVQAMDIAEWDTPAPIPFIEITGVKKLNA